MLNFWISGVNDKEKGYLQDMQQRRIPSHGTAGALGSGRKRPVQGQVRCGRLGVSEGFAEEDDRDGRHVQFR